MAATARKSLVGKTTVVAANVEARTWPADRVERRLVSALVPYARNARTHSEDQIAQIAASIREWGWTMPILVDEADGIIAGHGRVLAARILGLTEVPVMVARGWSDAQKRAYVIADNKLALNGGWDMELLPVEVGELKALGFDLNLTGFGELELGKILADEAGDLDDAPEPPMVPVSQHGDLWICGEHRVLCGDATVRADIDRLLDGELADMTFTDPPYNVNYRGKGRPILNDALGSEFESFLRVASSHILAVTKGAIYIAMSSSELDTLQRAFREAGGKWSTFVIWAKNAFTLGRSDYQRQYEPILYGWKDGVDHFWCGARDQGDVWFIDRPTKNDLHPTMKPVALVERAIRNSSKSRDIVLDPFGGSGTTMIAAERAGRRARLLELDPAYVDVIVARWQGATGGIATLAATAETVDRVKSSRLAVAAPENTAQEVLP